jgi:hypothetical protein
MLRGTRLDLLRDPRVAMIVVLAVGLWFPLAQVDWFWGHERASYVYRIVEWAAELKQGHLYPRWCPDLYGGFGSPLFVFHGPVPYAVAGLLNATFLDPYWSLKIVALLASLLSGVGMYALILGECRERDPALLGAVAYLAAPYRISNMFERGDVSEFLALGVLPVSIALYRAVVHEVLPRRARWMAAAAAAAHAVMIMTHPISGFWGTLLIGVIVAASALQLAWRGLWRRVVLLGVALVAAPGLAAIHVVPAIAYRSAAQTAKMVVGFYTASEQWILLKSLFYSNVPGTALPGTMYKVGPIAVAAGLVVLLALARRRRLGLRALGWFSLAFVLFALTQRQMSWFWVRGRVPLMELTQFPFRLLGPAVLTAAVALGVGMTALLERVPAAVRSWICILGGGAFLIGMAWPYLKISEMPIATVPSDPESVRNRIVPATDANEFLPRAVPGPPTAPPHALVASAQGATVDFTRSDGSRHMVGASAAGGEATVTLNLFWFPGWHAETVAGPRDARVDADAHGLLRLTLPAPGRYRVRVYYGASAGTVIGEILSLLTLVALGLFMARGSRFWPAPLPALAAARSDA